MYSKRIKIFIILSVLLLTFCMLRLIQMQLVKNSFYQKQITKLKKERWQYKQLKTVRGVIFDRKRIILAEDEPQFNLHIAYQLSSVLDERLIKAKMLNAAAKNDTSLADDIKEKINNKQKQLNRVISKCAKLKNAPPSEIKKRIQQINNHIWNLRAFQVWRKQIPDSELIQKYKNIISVPLKEAMRELENKRPDPQNRLKLIGAIEIAEMYQTWPLFELKNDDDILTAQLEFMNIDSIQIVPEAHRNYPYKSVAAQTIGWVGPATQKEDKKLFENDRLLKYLDYDICGREDGAEYVCEPLLRGRRGEKIYDIDRELVNKVETQLGGDVVLTIDIELQKRIENYIENYNHEPYCGPGFAAVVIQVSTGDILALVSLPSFDLNTARYDYDELANDPNKPLINRAINKRYPPGSVTKPIILIAGLQSNKVSPDEVISCPAKPAPRGWPNCWIYNSYKIGHDASWPNYARNAIKGSCNIYFSRLADRIKPETLQKWLFDFGYGHKFNLAPEKIQKNWPNKNFRQIQGIISSSIPKKQISTFEELPPLSKQERRWFGIGQGNLRANPLQVANAMAVIARDGLYKKPELFITNESAEDKKSEQNPQTLKPESIDLGISPETLKVIRDGMHAVVSETGGTAYKAFAHSGFEQENVKIYGKTGSTEAPNIAWFAGYAQDNIGKSISIAVAVEGGQHGSSDAAPLARDIIQFCINAGYIGKSNPPSAD